VLKTPPHTDRIPILLEIFPDAKFIFIHRDPYMVFKSTIHIRKKLFFENGLGKPYFEGIEEEILRPYLQLFETYKDTKHLIPDGNLHEVGFEDLEADPLGQMRQVYDKLGLAGWENVEPAIQAKVPALTSYKKNTYNIDEPLMRKI
jgi:hypothetical protein